MNDFLSDDYKVPNKADGYMKWQQGDNRFRIMGKPIVGWEWWIDIEDGKRKPIRVHKEDQINISEVPEPDKVKHFWAMVVWDYESKGFKILEITQKGIQKTITNLSRDKDWGSPFDYDIVVNKTGEKMETEYQTTPKPKKVLDETILKAYKALQVNLEALYDGEDPFAMNQKEKTSESIDEDLPIE